MHWLTIAYSMTAAACLTLAAVHLLVWLKQPAGRAHLAFAMTAIFVALIAPIELLMVRAQTIGQFGTAVRWIHLPGALLTFSLVWFLWLYFGTGRLWLACVACGLRLLTLILNFSFTSNINYREITGVRHVAILGGESFSVAVGVVSPWELLDQLSKLFLFLFILDASITLWRRGTRRERRRAIVVGGSLLFFILWVGGYVALILTGFIVSPIFFSFSFLAIVAAMGYELSSDVVKAGQLSLEVKANEQRLALAQEAGGIGVFDWDLRSGELRWTEKLESIYGLPPGGFGGRSENWRERVHPEDLLRFEAEINKALRQKLQVWQTQYRIVRANDSEIRWIDARAHLFFDAKTEPVRMLGVNVDITERRIAEGALSDSELKLSGIVNSAMDAIISIDEGQGIILFNPAAEKMFGCSASEMMGQSIDRLIPEPFRQVHTEHVRAFGETSITKRRMGHLVPLYGRRSDGSDFPIDASISHLEMNGQRFYTAIVRDITERKRAELQVLQQRSELAHLSRVTMLGELSGSLAHELNQPLGAILRNTEAAELFLQDPSPDLEEFRVILADIRKDDQRAGSVIDRMRSLVKRREVEYRLLDMNVLASEVIDLVKADADSRKIRLALEPASSLPPVRGDWVQLQQVLLNLLLNAMDAVNDSARDQRLVKVRVQSVGTLVEVTVSDSGHGIPPDKLTRLFEPFFTTKANGMGMGLPISRKIIQAHSGSLRAENNPDGGATFHFTLPVAKEGSAS